MSSLAPWPATSLSGPQQPQAQKTACVSHSCAKDTLPAVEDPRVLDSVWERGEDQVSVSQYHLWNVSLSPDTFVGAGLVLLGK